jgi:hypothetical protein
MSDAKFYVGKSLEALGLAITGLAFVVGVSGMANTRAELIYLSVGGLVFTIGWFIEGGGKKK